MTRNAPRVSGTIRRRLLVNALVDPDEAAARLPAGLRPHDTGQGTVVGCCLLEIDSLRPARLPAQVGITLRAAAHRISIDVPGVEGPGVYVPARHATSRLASLTGGRLFPGVHHRARLASGHDGADLTWRVTPHGGEPFDLSVAVAATGGPVGGHVVGTTCLAATLGLSPGHRGGIEAVRMLADPSGAEQVTVVELQSSFVDGFASARPAPAYLMRDAAVAWSPVRALVRAA